MTPGASAETADGMSEGKIDQIIELMRHERYRFTPARRTYIPKKNGQLRPLGLPFGSLDHEVMLATLAEKIHDGRFLQLVSRMLKAGYLEDWTWHATLSGSPQGGIATPPTQKAISVLR